MPARHADRDLRGDRVLDLSRAVQLLGATVVVVDPALDGPERARSGGDWR